MNPPFHLSGNYAPVAQEVAAFDLSSQGAIPAELRGLYVRNGPNPKTGQSPHWFVGDGMLHGVALRDGKAEWCRQSSWILPPQIPTFQSALGGKHFCLPGEPISRARSRAVRGEAVRRC